MVDIAVSETALKTANMPSKLLRWFSIRNQLKNQQNYFELICMEAQDTAHDRRKKDLVPSTANIIFRLDPTINWHFYTDELNIVSKFLKQNYRRNEHNNQFLAFSKNYEIHLKEIYSVNPIKKFDASKFLQQCRNNELSNFVQSTYSMFEHAGHAYFELPSKNYSDYFFRVGNVQTENMFSNSVFFWSLPYLADVSSIFADTWSISTTAAKMSKYLTKYRADTKLVPWEFSSNYLPYAEIGKAKFKKALSNLSDGEQMLFLTSFTSSGRLFSEVQNLAHQVGKKSQSRYVSIFASSEFDQMKGDYLCDIHENLSARNLKGRCESVPPPDKPIFEVHSRAYFPDYRKINVTKFRVKYAKYKNFFERYASKGVMSVYKTGSTAPYPNKDGFSTKNRHHSFHISAAKLFSDHDYKAQFIKETSAISNEDLGDFAFLTNDTDPSNLLCNLFEKSRGKSAVENFVARSSNFLGIEDDQELRDFLGRGDNANKTLIVTVPMVVGGGSLANIQRELRSIVSGEGRIKPNIIILIGVMRPNSTRKVNELSNIYLNRDESPTSGWARSLVIETVVLPNWQEQKCPWHREHSIIVSTLKNPNIDKDTRTQLLERKEFLDTASNEGLKSKETFFTQTKERLIFNPSSRFLDLDKVQNKIDLLDGSNEDDFGFLGLKTLDDQVSEADLCCAVASAMQVWREEAQTSPLHFSTIDTATIDNLNGYNESRLRAAIWRALTPKELSSVTRVEGNDFVNLAQLIFDKASGDRNYTDLSLEALLAFQMDLPRTLNLDIQSWDWYDYKYMAGGTRL